MVARPQWTESPSYPMRPIGFQPACQGQLLRISSVMLSNPIASSARAAGKLGAAR